MDASPSDEQLGNMLLLLFAAVKLIVAVNLRRNEHSRHFLPLDRPLFRLDNSISFNDLVKAKGVSHSLLLFS